MIKTLFISDTHHPNVDVRAWNIMIDFATDWKPDTVIINGDWWDAYQISDHKKDPERAITLQSELDHAGHMLSQLRRAVGEGAMMCFKVGTHERRLQKYLWEHPELKSLKSLELSVLLNLDKENVRLVEEKQPLIIAGLYITHGDLVSKHSSYTAKVMWEKFGVSGISGHTHRLGFYAIRRMGNEYRWWENGCLCSKEAEYVEFPNWQHGFTFAYSDKFESRNPDVHTVFIPEIGNAIINGKVYSGV